MSLDRQRNAALQDNHRSYLQTIATQARDLLGDRTEAFREASDEILHNWDRTVADFERRLREAETEDAIREIETEFIEAQEQMLASLESVLIELGFTADQAAEIMTEVFRTAENESDSFAGRVISAFQRLGREADRETKRQNREVERSYREMTRDIENVLRSISDFFIDIANDGDIEDAFRNLGERIGSAVLGEFEQAIAGQIAASITGEVAAGTGSGAGLAGASPLLSLLSNPVALAATAFLALPAYGAYRHLTDDDVAPAGRGRGIAPIGDLPSEPFNRGQRYSRDTPTFARGRGYQREIDDAIAEIDAVIEETVEQSVEAFGGFYGITLRNLQERLDQASFNLDFAELTGRGVDDAIQGIITANVEFYQHQIDEINRVRRETGELSFGNAEELARTVQGIINDARLALESTGLTTRGASTGRYQARVRENIALAQRTGTDRQAIEDVARLQYGTEAYDAEVAAATAEQETPETVAEDVLAGVIQAINEDVQLINASITGIETQLDQASEPEEIAALLDQLPALIREKYRGLREALDEKYAADEISTDVYNASLTQLNSSESAELEQQSDAVLANALQINSEAVESISVGIRDLENRIAQSNDPTEIQTLLAQIAEQIPEIYSLRREALQAQYDAGEITKTALENGIAQLNIDESAALEQNSDQQLANTPANQPAGYQHTFIEYLCFRISYRPIE